MGSKPKAPAPEPKKVDRVEVAEARNRATKRSRSMIGGSQSLLTGGFAGYGQKDTLG